MPGIVDIIEFTVTFCGCAVLRTQHEYIKVNMKIISEKRINRR